MDMNIVENHKIFGRSQRTTNGASPINKSLINNTINVLVLILAILSNSSCIFLSTKSDIFSAPPLAASIATAIQADLFVILTDQRACSLKTQSRLRRRT